MTDNFYRDIDASAQRLPQKLCWVVPNRGTWSFARVSELAARFSVVLQRLGVEPGDRVLAQIDKSPEGLLLYFACLRSGAVFVPLNTAYTARELEHFVSDCEPQLIVADPAKAETLRGVASACGARLRTLGADGNGDWMAAVAAVSAEADTPGDASKRVAMVPRQVDDLAAIVYTSGTTGRSKGAMLTHGNLRANARALTQLWAFCESDVLLHALPVYHIHGLFVALHCALLAGATTRLLPKFDVESVLAALPGATVFMGVPTYYTRLLGSPRFDRTLVESIRLFVCGSAPLLPSTFAQFEQHTGRSILERYGMSEAGIITSNPYDGERLAGTVGFALPGVSIRIADARGQELPRGQAGVLEVKGANVFCGYWRSPGKTADEFRSDGYFITGDVATMADNGRVSIVGRAKDLVISGGFNIYPREIELEIDLLPGVVESAVIGVPHADFGEAVVAVVAATPAASVTELQILSALQARLAKFKLPKRVFLVDDLPRNALGKVQKALLREKYASIFTSGL